MREARSECSNDELGRDEKSEEGQEKERMWMSSANPAKAAAPLPFFQPFTFFFFEISREKTEQKADSEKSRVLAL
jgi:hypothetical protein